MRNPFSWVHKTRNQDATTGSSDQDQDKESEQDRDTGPIQRPQTHFEQQRALIDSFDEDKLDRWDTIKLFAAKLAALLLPIVAVYAVGNELGQFFANGASFSLANSWIASQYLIAYAGETALAVLTYILGNVFSHKPDSTGFYIKAGITTAVWLLFIAASALGQWYVAVNSLHVAGSIGYLTIGIRVGMACSLDIAAVCLMWWRGRSLAQFLEQQQKKAESIRAVSESELAIDRAQADSDRRRREDEQYLQGKAAREHVLLRIEEIQAQALIGNAERSLLLPPAQEKERGYY